MNKENARSYILFISTMLVFGTIGIFRKYITLSSGMIAFCRGLLGSFFLYFYLAIKGHKRSEIKKKSFILLAISGIIMGFNWILLFEAYNYTTVAISTMCYYMQPTILILLSPIVLGEKLTAKKLFCAMAAIVGMMFVSGMMDGVKISSQDILGIIFGLGAAIFYAVVIILNKKVQMEDAYLKTLIQLISATVILIPYLILTENWAEINLDALAVIMVVIVGVVHTGIAYAVYFGSMKDLSAQSIAVLSYIDPVFALLLSSVVLHEKLSVFGLVGAVLIIGSAVISELNIKKKA